MRKLAFLCDTDVMQYSPSSEELSAWIRLTLEPGLGPAQARSLLSAVGLPQDIYALSASALGRHIPAELARQLKQVPDSATQETIERTHEWLSQPQHHVLTLADPAYPSALLTIHDPPLVLYVNGRIECLSHPTISIVGARSATAAGMDNARAFAHYLATHGWCIASGLANGIDAAAHQGALQAGATGGSTIAVLGTGPDIVYPAANRDLAHKIAAQGALVSEFPLGTRPRQYQFPKRNRIIAGLARGVLVVEAARQSGSLLTARMASEMGREVFAIPGSIHSPLARGCHALIRQGAKLVESGQDIHEELGQPASALAKPSYAAERSKKTLPRRTGDNSGQTPPPTASSPEADPTLARIVAALGYDPITIDVLQERSAVGIAELSNALLELELTDRIERLKDGRYQRR